MPKLGEVFFASLYSNKDCVWYSLNIHIFNVRLKSVPFLHYKGHTITIGCDRFDARFEALVEWIKRVALCHHHRQYHIIIIMTLHHHWTKVLLGLVLCNYCSFGGAMAFAIWNTKTTRYKVWNTRFMYI